MSKMKNKEGISKLRTVGIVYEKTKEQAEIMKKSFQKILAVESEVVEKE